MAHVPDHPVAIVGLSNILLDIYTEALLPPPAIPGLSIETGPAPDRKTSSSTFSTEGVSQAKAEPQSPLPSEPLGLATSKTAKLESMDSIFSARESVNRSDSELPAPYKATSLPLVDRLAARDRAHGLLSAVTRLGTAWNYPEAWFSLARAHEESGQAEKAKEVLWWCVELEEGLGVREWSCVGPGGYVL